METIEVVAIPVLMGYERGMSKPWKKTVQTALHHAADDRMIPKIAKQTGIPATRLYNFSSQGCLNHDDLRTLEQWLMEHDYMDGKPPEDKSAVAALAAEFRAVADLLDSHELSNAAKAQKLASCVKGWSALVDEYARILKKTQ